MTGVLPTTKTPQGSEREYEKQRRVFSKSHFNRNHINDECIQESGCYIPTTGCASMFEWGFIDWKHSTERLAEQENSCHHKNKFWLYSCNWLWTNWCWTRKTRSFGVSVLDWSFQTCVCYCDVFGCERSIYSLLKWCIWKTRQ